MQERKFRSPEEWATEMYGQWLFRGYFEAVRNLFYLLLKLNATTVLVFMRRKFGTRSIGSGTIFYGGFFFGFCMILDMIFHIGGSVSALSLGVFFTYATVYYVVAFFHNWESWRNLRREDGRGELRHGHSMGVSLIWPIIVMIFGSTGLINDGTSYTRWYQLDHFKFQKYVEPMFLILLSQLVADTGFSGFSNFLLFGGISVYFWIKLEEDNYYRLKQDSIDAEILSYIVKDPQSDIAEQTGLVIQNSLFRRSTREYEQWRRDRQPERRFESNEAMLGRERV